MHCDKCGQPLQPWEVAACEPCLRRIQNFPNPQLTQQQSAATLPPRPSKAQGGFSKGHSMNGFLVVVRYSCYDVPVQMFDQHGEHAAVQLAADIAGQPCDVHTRYPKAFEALGINRPQDEPLAFAVSVLRVANGWILGCVDEFYADADDDIDDDDDECDFD